MRFHFTTTKTEKRILERLEKNGGGDVRLNKDGTENRNEVKAFTRLYNQGRIGYHREMNGDSYYVRTYDREIV